MTMIRETLPQINSTVESRLRNEMLTACRALNHLKLSAGPFGNVSVRIPNSPFYLENPAGIFFENLTAQDFVILSESGEKIHGKHDRHQGDYIHRAIYQRRKDVQAIVHTHSHYTVLLACLEEVPRPWTQVGAAFTGDIGIYNGFTGPVRDQNEGDAIAEGLGSKSVVMAARHGFFVARNDLAAAVWDLFLLEQVSREHLDLARVTDRSPPELTPAALEKSRICIRHEFVSPFWENMKKTLNGAQS